MGYKTSPIATMRPVWRDPNLSGFQTRGAPTAGARRAGLVPADAGTSRAERQIRLRRPSQHSDTRAGRRDPGLSGGFREFESP